MVNFLSFDFLCFPLGFLSSPLTSPVRGFPVVWELLHDSHPTTGPRSKILCSPFHLYPLPCLLPRRLVCFSGHLGSSAGLQRLFCESCSMCRWSFDAFVGKKVVSLSVPPPSWDVSSISQVNTSPLQSWEGHPQCALWPQVQSPQGSSSRAELASHGL